MKYNFKIDYNNSYFFLKVHTANRLFLHQMPPYEALSPSGGGEGGGLQYLSTKPQQISLNLQTATNKSTRLQHTHYEAIQPDLRKKAVKKRKAGGVKKKKECSIDERNK